MSNDESLRRAMSDGARDSAVRHVATAVATGATSTSVLYGVAGPIVGGLSLAALGPVIVGGAVVGGLAYLAKKALSD